MSKRTDWTNKRYGKLTFIRATALKRFSRIRWEAVCDCGATVCVVPKDGYSCGCHRVEVATRIGHNSKNVGITLYTPDIALAHDVWSGRYRECEFDIFYTMSQQPCHYCNAPPKNVAKRGSRPGTFTYNGLDRIDSTKGHIVGNIVPCCIDCNKAKLDKTFDEFIDHIERMYHHTRRFRA